MQLRQFGRLPFRVSALGFGAMRLPTKEGGIDEAEAIRMIRRAIDQGVNYIDTAYPYHDGKSEGCVGRALAGGYREKVKLATKLPSWLVHSPEDFSRFLDEQLLRLQVDKVDFYLLHSLNGETWIRLRDLGVLGWAEKELARGRVGHLAFSFHGDDKSFRQIIDAYDWPMCQVQYNFMDAKSGPGTEGVRYAADKGVAVVVMEPLRGGKLVSPPPSIQAVWDKAVITRSPAGWALEWLWNQPEVATVLSGMSAMEQVEENIRLASGSGPHSLSKEEAALYDEARDRYEQLTVIPCTACRYCMPCPHGVDIPGNLGVYNEGVMFDKPDAARGQYGWWKYAFEVQHIFDHDLRAAQCTQCGSCEEKCPQAIPIQAWMPVIHQALGEKGPYVRTLEQHAPTPGAG